MIMRWYLICSGWLGWDSNSDMALSGGDLPYVKIQALWPLNS